MSEKIVIYEANYKQKIGYLKTWFVMFKNIVSSRDLIIQLFKRDFFMTFRKSFLGVSWVILSPIIGIVSWVFMNFTGILKPGDVGIPYPAYVLLSTSIWGLFMGFYTSASGTLSAGSGFILQVRYPHEALLIKQIAQQLANFLITFIITMIVLLIFGVTPNWKVVFFPIVILPLFFLGAGLGLIMCVIIVVASDVEKIMTLLFTLLMYCTPVIYSKNTSNHLLKFIININPLTYLIGGVRDLIIYGKIEGFYKFIIFGIISFIFFLFSWRLFYISEDRIIEKML